MIKAIENSHPEDGLILIQIDRGEQDRGRMFASACCKYIIKALESLESFVRSDVFRKMSEHDRETILDFAKNRFKLSDTGEPSIDD